MKYQVALKSSNLQSSDLENNDKVKIEQRTDQEALKQLGYFKEEILPVSTNFASEIKDQIVRRVISTSDGAWIVETMSKNYPNYYQPNYNETRSTVEERNIYLLKDNAWKKLTVNPILCYIEKSKIVKHDLNIPLNTPLKEDMLILFGACNGGDYLVSLYKYPTGEKVNFTDPRNLILTNLPNGYDWLKSKIVNPDGDTLSFSTLETYGKEPVIVVDFIRTDSYEPPRGPDTANPSQGIGIFSVRTGQLIDLIIYNSF